MRKLLVAGIVLVLLFGAVIAAALLFVSTEDLRARLEREIETALGRETQVGSLELTLFPLPAVRVNDLRIAGESALVAPLAEIESVRLRLAILPLLRGRTSIASLGLERPRLVIPVDASGRPILPRARDAAATAPAASPAASPAAAEPGAGETAAGAALLAIDAFHVREGSVRVGRYRFESVELDGSLGSAGHAEVWGSLELPDIARIEDVDVEIDGLGAPEWTALASARVEGGDLGGITRMARLGKGYEGKVDLAIEGLRLANFTASDGRIRGRLRDLDVRRNLLVIDGEASLDADARGNWKLDLADAGIHYATLEKARGTPLALEGPFPEAPAQRLSARLILPGNAIDFVANYPGNDTPTLALEPSTVELAPLAPLLGLPVGGRVKLAPSLILLGPPPSLAAKATLENVSYPVVATSVSASGDVDLRHERLLAPSLRVRVAEQPFDVGLTFSLAGWFDTTWQGTGLDVEALAAGLAETRDVSGTATLRSVVRGYLKGDETLPGLDGSGRVEIAPGRIKGFSILRQTFGELAAVPLVVAALRGKDLARYEEEEFQSLTADYLLTQGKLTTKNLKLVYRNATAELEGDVRLVDGALNLAGRLLLARDVDAALGPTPDAKPRVIPIAGIGGTVTKPRVKLDQEAVLAIAGGLTGTERIQKKLEEKLGPGAGEAVEDVLDLLRGRKKEAAP